MSLEVFGKMNWDLSSYFPAFNGAEMRAFKEALGRDIKELCEKAMALPCLNTRNAKDWEKVFQKGEEVMAHLSHLDSYVGCLSACDARNEEYLKEEAAVALLVAEASKADIEMLRAIGGATDRVFDAFAKRRAFKDMGHYLSRMREKARHMMTVEKERLAADLGVDGISAWGRLYGALSGRLEFEMEYPDGRRERLPISQRRSLMEDPDRLIRRAAFVGGNAAWQSIEGVAASALNAISGTRLTLNRHRGIDHFLDVALFQASITRKTLDALFQAIYENLEIPRRFLRLKARMMGTKGVAWYDLGAPLALPEKKHLPWEVGRQMVTDSFARAYPALGRFIREAIDRRWVEWEPRAGKRPGAFCIGSLLTKESRVFMTYNGQIGDACTLAHEMGHAFHSHVMRDLRPYAHLYPMTFAETASNFAEMLLSDGLLVSAETNDEWRKFILDQDLGHAAVYLMDIPVRYEFEKALYEERAKGELSVSQLKGLMSETQRRIFMDTLEEGGDDPYFWASKLHFYITEVTFYNFPYTFGFLLSRGLFNMLKHDGAAFLPRYERFLELTGKDTCENVARVSIGRDLETPAFWCEAIRSLEEPLGELEAMSGKD